MLGILVAIAISWGIIYFYNKKSIFKIWTNPPQFQLKNFAIGFIVTSFLCFGLQVFETSLKSIKWVVNQNLEVYDVYQMFYFDIRSVVTEELIFRGVLLYLLIDKIGSKKSIIISSIAFGVYHWFSYGLLGNIVPMVVIFIATGLMGYALALSYARTNSIMMPIGLHLGWNFTLNTIFSKGPLGNGVFMEAYHDVVSDWFSLIGLWLPPIILIYIIHRLLNDKEGIKLYHDAKSKVNKHSF